MWHINPLGIQKSHIFEHPLNERIRAFLRLDPLLNEIHAQMRFTSVSAISRMALTNLVDLITLTERGDLKWKILTELERQQLLLIQLRDSGDVDQQRLDSTLSVLERIKSQFNALMEHPPKELKSNAVLNLVRGRSGITGSTCAFDLPALHCWSDRPGDECSQDLFRWLNKLEPMESALRLILHHLRESGIPEQIQVSTGQYTCIPATDNPPTLLRITLPHRGDIFPQISAGRHRITIRFFRLSPHGRRAETLAKNISFTLNLCRF